MQKRLKTQVQMSRASDDNWYLRVTDQASHSMIVEVVLDAEQFSDLLSTRTAHDVGVIAYDHDKIGNEMENKQVVVPGLGYDNWRDRFVLVDRFLAANHPEWTPDSLGDQINGHRTTSDGGYEIIIRRWIEVK